MLGWEQGQEGPPTSSGSLGSSETPTCRAPAATAPTSTGTPLAVLEDIARTPLTTALLSLAAKAMGLGSLLYCRLRAWLHRSALTYNCTTRCKFRPRTMALNILLWQTRGNQLPAAFTAGSPQHGRDLSLSRRPECRNNAYHADPTGVETIPSSDKPTTQRSTTWPGRLRPSRTRGSQQQRGQKRQRDHHQGQGRRRS
jgi:hypothetical protein